ncbi:MAG: hypothetical protein JW827_12110, partial [Spirochaetes bacterium]|nr:hypothetical protein [Spirochaetota bacterium]
TKYQFLICKNGFIILYRKDKVSNSMEQIVSILYDNLNKFDPPDLFNRVYFDNNKLVHHSKPVIQDNKKRVFRPEYLKWGNEKMSQTFLLNNTLLEQMCGEIGFKENKDHVRIKCGDIECYQRYHPLFLCEPARLIFNTYNKYPFFLEKIQQHFETNGKDKRQRDRLFRNTMLTNSLIEFKEEEVIFGSDPKVFQIMEEIIKIIEKKDISLAIVDTCINRIIGSDLTSFITKLRQRNKSLKIIYEGQHNSPSEKDDIRKEFGNLIWDILKSRRMKKTDPRAINLIGFEEDRATGEIINLLDQYLKIRVNTILFPKVDLITLPDFFKARLQVVNCFKIYHDSYNRIIAEKIRNLNALVLPSPYGIRQTAEWLRSIGKYFGISLEKSREWKKYWRSKIREWNRLKQQAEKFRLGIIISGDDVDSLIDPSELLYGIPFLKFLGEMGFGLDILINTRENFDIHKQSILEILKDRKHRVQLLNNDEKLEEWIDKGNSDCIYSDFRSDMRILLHGRNSFSLFLFEKGIEGALRTLKELLRLCKMSFYKKYQKYNSRNIQPLVIEQGNDRSKRY